MKDRSGFGTGFHPGDVLLDTYRVESEAFQGGMGAVWRVHHTGWNVDLAMKRPRPEAFRTQDQKKDFTGECRYWMNLGLHPNIVSCYYVREIEGIPTIFSEWMDRGSLESHIKDGSLYDGSAREVQARLLDIAIQFARGLRYAHENDLIHQDVKPDNLLLTGNWSAKISDFGLARARTMLTIMESDATVLEDAPDATMVSPSGGRTPAYCSPEQAAGQLLTKRTDIYSWAVSVLEMYLGFKPWAHGRDLTGPLVGYAYESYFEMCTQRPVPETLQKLLARCLEPNPDDRLSDFGAVESALTSLYAGYVGEEYPRPVPSTASVTADYFNNRALSFLDLGEFENAASCWDQSLRLDPGHQASLFNRTLTLYRRDQLMPWEAEAALDAIRDEEERNSLIEILNHEIQTVISQSGEPADVPFEYEIIRGQGKLVSALFILTQYDPAPVFRADHIGETIYNVVSRQFFLWLPTDKEYVFSKRKPAETLLDHLSITASRDGRYVAYTVRETVPGYGKKFRNPQTVVVDLSNITGFRKWVRSFTKGAIIETAEVPDLRTFDHENGLLSPDGTVVGFSFLKERPEDCSAAFYNVRDGRLISRVNGTVFLGFTWTGRVLLFSAGRKILFGGKPDRPVSKDTRFCSGGELNRNAFPGSLLHQVSDHFAVLETRRERERREGLLLDLIEGRVVAPLRWEGEAVDPREEIGAFHLTGDGHYLVWLTKKKVPLVKKGRQRRAREFFRSNTYVAMAQFWDMKTGKYAGRSSPAMPPPAEQDQVGQKFSDHDFQGILLSLASGQSVLRYAPEQRADYLLSMISSTEARLEAGTAFRRLMKRAEDAVACGDRSSAIRFADKARTCPGFESDLTALQLRAKAGEGLSKKRLQGIIPVSGAALLPLVIISAGSEDRRQNSLSDADWREIKKDFIDIDHSIYTYVGKESLTEDGRYRLIPTLELWEECRDAGWENEVFVDYTNYFGATVEEVASGRIIREYHRLYSYKTSEWRYLNDVEYGSTLHVSDNGLWLLTRGDGLDLRPVDDGETKIHVADGMFQYAALLTDGRFVLAQRLNGNVEVYDLTKGEEKDTFDFAGEKYGRVRYINDNCFAIGYNESEQFYWLDWEYEGESI
ncbi:MAG: protein kinase [Eubacteriales bacterium]|nr:protein kinase [Eubacteriales bacterium]